MGKMPKLVMDIDGIELLFHIHEFYPSSRENWDDEWAKISFRVTSGEWLNYIINYQEIMMMCEIEQLRDILHKQLSNDLTEVYELECLEPDLTFRIIPLSDFRESSKTLSIKEDFEIIDIDLQIDISFWNEGLTANKLTLSLDRNEIENLACYLDVVTDCKVDAGKLDSLYQTGILRK